VQVDGSVVGRAILSERAAEEAGEIVGRMGTPEWMVPRCETCWVRRLRRRCGMAHFAFVSSLRKTAQYVSLLGTTDAHDRRHCKPPIQILYGYESNVRLFFG
jgi:hypothetical protein